MSLDSSDEQRWNELQQAMQELEAQDVELARRGARLSATMQEAHMAATALRAFEAATPIPAPPPPAPDAPASAPGPSDPPAPAPDAPASAPGPSEPPAAAPAPGPSEPPAAAASDNAPAPAASGTADSFVPLGLGLFARARISYGPGVVVGVGAGVSVEMGIRAALNHVEARIKEIEVSVQDVNGMRARLAQQAAQVRQGLDAIMRKAAGGAGAAAPAGPPPKGQA